jgi:hypothetical protein
LDRGKEATVLGTVGRLRRLAAMVGGEYARDDGRAGRYFLLLSGKNDSSLDLCTNFFAVKQ